MKQRVFNTPRILRHTPLILLTAILTSCATGRIDPTDPVGENAKQIDGIMRLSGYMATAVGIFVAIAVVVVNTLVADGIDTVVTIVVVVVVVATIKVIIVSLALIVTVVAIVAVV